MKNKSLFIASLLVFVSASTLSSCGEANNEQEIKKSEDKIIKNLPGKPDANNAKDVIFSVLGKLDDATFFEKKSSTKTEANKGFINYVQNTTSLSIKNNDEYYINSSSTSDFVNMEHEAFYKDNFITFRDDKGEINNVKFADYSDVYGVTPNKLLSGQIFNNETILSIKLESNENDIFTYKIELDKESSNALLIQQMKKFGNLKSYPVFTSNTEFELSINSNYEPISYSSLANYDISVPVLGNMSCKEETTAEFSKFNEQVEIPNYSQFKEALNKKPIDLGNKKEVEVNEEIKTILSALLNTDIANGVAINGNLNINDFKIPYKVNARANLEKFIRENENVDFRSILDMTIVFNKNLGDLKITLHENKIYLETFNRRYAFNLPTSNGDLDFDIENLQEIFEVKKDSEIKGQYNIKLSNEYQELLTNKLDEIGLFDNANFDFSLALNIENNKIKNIDFDVLFGEKTISTNAEISNESYVLPNLDNFETKINLKTSLAIALQDKLGEILNGDINFSYDTSETNFLKAITLNAKLKIDEKIIDSLKSVASMTELPSVLSAFYNASYCHFIIKDGNFYILGTSNDNKVIFFKKISLANENSDGLLTNLLFNSKLFGLNDLFDFTFNKNGISFDMSEEKLNLINSFLPSLYDNSLNKIGVLGTSSLFGIFGLYRRISSVNINIPSLDLDNFEVSFEVNAYDMSQKDVFNEKIKYNTSNLFKINLKRIDSDDNYEINWDLEEIEKNNDLASELIHEIDNFQNNFSLSDDYLNELEKFASKYNDCSEEIRNLIYNSNVYSSKETKFVVDDLKSQISNDKKVVDQFAINCSNSNFSLNSLNNTYKTLSNAQLDYLEKEYEDALNLYLSRREASEESVVKQLEKSINSLTTVDLKTLDCDELYKYLNSLVNIDKQLNNCLPTSISNIDLTLFDSELTKTIEEYVDVYSDLADGYVNEMTNFKNVCNMSVDELNKYYSSLEKFYSKYYSAFSSSTIGETLKSSYPSFEAKMYRVELYLKYNGHGFLVGAISAIENEINDILNNKYERNILEPKINELKKLFKRVNTSNISNYNDILPIIETLESENVKEKLIEYTNAINELLLNGSEEDIADFFDWGWNDYSYDEIVSFFKSVTYIQQINNEQEYKVLDEALKNIADKKSDDFDW